MGLSKMLIKLEHLTLTVEVPLHPMEGNVNKDSAIPQPHHYCNSLVGKARIHRLEP